MARNKKQWTPEERAHQAEAMRKKWQDPEYREKTHTAMQEIGEERRKNISEKLKAKWQDPEFRAKQSIGRSAGAKARWADPVKRAAIMARRAELKAEQDKNNG